MNKARKLISLVEEEKPLMIVASTGVPQSSSGGSEKGRVFSVIYQGNAASASTRDYKKAVEVADRIAKQSKVEVAYWDGDKGEFVNSLDDLIGNVPGRE
jgi:hypothetical protein